MNANTQQSEKKKQVSLAFRVCECNSYWIFYVNNVLKRSIICVSPKEWLLNKWSLHGILFSVQSLLKNSHQCLLEVGTAAMLVLKPTKDRTSKWVFFFLAGLSDKFNFERRYSWYTVGKNSNNKSSIMNVNLRVTIYSIDQVLIKTGPISAGNWVEHSEFLLSIYSCRVGNEI